MKTLFTTINPRTIILVFSLLFLNRAVSSQEASYQPLLQDGKEWVYQLEYLDGDLLLQKCQCRFWIEGTTMIDGKVFYRMYSTYSDSDDTPVIRYWHEDNGKVYVQGKGGLNLVYDFTLGTGDLIPREGLLDIGLPGFLVGAVDTVNVHGIKRKRLTIDMGFTQGIACWVEGVGCTRRLDEPLGHLGNDSRAYTLLSCHVGDECIFEKEDFTKEGISPTPDYEYFYKEIVAPQELKAVEVGAPLIASKKCSHVEMLYKREYMNLWPGELITQLVYKGYNLGEPFARHFVVWMSNTEQRRVDNNYGITMTPVETMTKVFEGDCTIASGGSEDERIPLLTIKLDQPFEYGQYTLRVVIESIGEPTTQDVCFEHYKYRWECGYVTADEAGHAWSQPDYSLFPLTTITVASPVINLTGTVRNQDGDPVPDAQIHLKSTDWNNTVSEYFGETDHDGRYAIRIEEGNKGYYASVSAPGCATFQEGWMASKVKDRPVRNFTLYDVVEYKAGRRATIIMPVSPDASKGRYFRMDRTEGRQLIFERELSPQANVPYVIFPDVDFEVGLDTLDLAMTAGKTSIPGVDFVGSYVNYDFPTNTNQELYFMDETVDGGCEYSYNDFWGYYYVVGGRIAALRACVIDEGWWGNEIIFHDDTNGISPSCKDNPADAPIYDLQGRRVAGMKPGIYIQGGKKVVNK